MKPTLFFLDGTAFGPGNIALAAQYNDHADVDASRVLLRLDGEWVKVDFDDDVIRSLAFSEADGTLFLLGTSGAIYTIGGRSPQFTKLNIRGTLSKQQVVDPEDRGELFKVRAVGRRVLACGQGGQVFEFADRAWQPLGLVEPTLSCPDFEDITVDTAGPIAVGSNGSMYRFTPSGNQRLDPPTNHFLSSIVTAPNGQSFACGNNGVVLSIDGAVFRDLSVHLETVRNLWGLAPCQDALYVCEPGRLLKRKWSPKADWEVEQVTNAVVPSFYRLASLGEELWSIGADHVFVKRGHGWTQLQVPGNEVTP